MLPCYRLSSILLLQMTNKPRQEEEEGGCYLVHQRFVHQILPAAQPQGTIAPTVAHTKDNMSMYVQRKEVTLTMGVRSTEVILTMGVRLTEVILTMGVRLTEVILTMGVRSTEVILTMGVRPMCMVLGPDCPWVQG